MSNLKVGLCTIGLVLVWVVVLATAEDKYPATAQALRLKATALESKWKHTPPIAEWAGKQERNCKALCQHCGCLGFYCGEECICECNNENSDTECIATMQKNAKQLNIPFELLIQGPSSNRFVRNAMQFGHEMQPNMNTDKLQAARNKRSTVVIYKPETDTEGETVLETNERIKRSNGQLDWFNDLRSALVRPAPINKRSKITSQNDEDSSAAVHKRSPKLDLDRSWFVDNSNNQDLLRPAPISKRQSSKRKDFDSSREVRDTMAVVENIPRVIKNTLRSFQDNGEDLSDFWTRRSRSETRKDGVVETIPRVIKNTLRSFQDNSEDQSDFWAGLSRGDTHKDGVVETIPRAIKNTLRSFQDNDEDKADFWTGLSRSSTRKPARESNTKSEVQRWRDNLVDAFERFMENNNQERSTSTTTSTTPATLGQQHNGQMLIPQWLRPMRFLQRVSHALN